MVFGYTKGICCDDVWKNQLCVPDDNLDDLEFFPNFCDDLIRLAGFPLNEELDAEDLWKDFDSAISSPPIFPYKQETNLSVFQDEKSRDGMISIPPKFPHEQETNLSVFQDEESRGAVFRYEQKTGQEIREESSKPSVRKSCLSVKRRICSHCEAEKTPQWREGPNGPKTLCNACGVRYKSGRLVPEYRPAASPSFDSSKHSNFHKRIVRKGRSYRKEIQ